MATRLLATFELALFFGGTAGDYKPGHSPADLPSHRRKGLRGTPPAELLHILEQGGVGAQRGQTFEQQRLLPSIAQDGVRELFEVAVLRDQSGRRFGADSRDSR